ncbi:MAG TPA: sterol desaturase family protein, partial [Solirubrobacteraceae bacterium]
AMNAPPDTTTSADAISRSELLRLSPRMFDSALLDRLSRVHPAVPPLLFAPAIVVLAAVALRQRSAGEVAGLFASGWVFWTLTEYWIHRGVFHFEPETGLGARLHWIVHGVHHDHPNDRLRLVMPPSVSVPLSSAFVVAFVVVLGTTAGLGFGAGFLAGYLAYDMTHYHLHHGRPSTPVGRRFRELHMRHHFQDDATGFGISAPVWDRVFGTATEQR